jgi:hypothetical protein
MNTSEVPIASPCGQDWTTMKPGDKGRYCGACKKTVHDLSALTKREARALLAAPTTEGLCVRYLYDAHGDIAFTDTVPASRLVCAKRALVAAAALALPMTLNACMGAQARPVPPPDPDMQQVTGAVAMPPMPADAGPTSPVTPAAPPPATPVTPANPIEIDQR